jgi:hypothetical protein
VKIRTEVTNNTLASLQKQSGNVDFFALNDGTNDERLLCISFWTSREDTKDNCRARSGQTILPTRGTLHRLGQASAELQNPSRFPPES